MIVEIDGKRVRKAQYQTYKIIGTKKYELHYTYRKRICQTDYWTLQSVNICLGYDGRLATSVGDIFGDGEKIRRYEISFNKLPDNVKKQVVVAIKSIEENGTPIENNESVFSG